MAKAYNRVEIDNNKHEGLDKEQKLSGFNNELDYQ